MCIIGIYLRYLRWTFFSPLQQQIEFNVPLLEWDTIIIAR